jgi:hypothetical protein
VALWQVVTGSERRLSCGPAGRGPEQLVEASLIRAGDEAIIATTGLGELRNVVEVAGLPQPDGGG